MNFSPRKDISEGESVMVKYVCCVLGRYKQLQDLTGSKNVEEVWMKGPGGEEYLLLSSQRGGIVYHQNSSSMATMGRDQKTTKKIGAWQNVSVCCSSTGACGTDDGQ
jgi:hypothetical protein